MRFIILLFYLLLSGIYTGCSPKKAITTEPVKTETVFQSTGLNLGNLAPDISATDPSGQIITLSSLRGKLVLVDFWASWCGPCRYENPAVVKAFHRFKNSEFRSGKGLAIYSVSLDANAEAWKKAIEKDGLIWSEHVSDLKGWNSEPAAKYNVGSIPTNFLLNEKGIIINKNLRGEELYKALEQLEIKK